MSDLRINPDGRGLLNKSRFRDSVYVADRGGRRQHSPLEGVVEKPLAGGGVVFTPLTRGDRGVGF